jgi:hypothetical protein
MRSDSTAAQAARSSSCTGRSMQRSARQPAREMATVAPFGAKG